MPFTSSLATDFAYDSPTLSSFQNGPFWDNLNTANHTAGIGGNNSSENNAPAYTQGEEAVITVASYDFDHVTIKMYPFGNRHASLRRHLSFGTPNGNRYSIWLAGNTLHFGRRVSGVDTSIASIAYSETTHYLLRMYLSGGVIYFATSPDDATPVWTVRASETWNASVPTNGKIGFGIASVDATVPEVGFANFDSLNTYAFVAPGEATLSAVSSQSFEVLGGTGAASVRDRATSTASFGELGGSASGSVKVSALTSGAFEGLGGSAVATIQLRAASSQAFAEIGGESTASVAGAADSTGSFGEILGSATGSAPASALSDGAFEQVEGDSTASVVSAVTSEAAFEPLQGDGTVSVLVAAISSSAFDEILGSAAGSAPASTLSDGAFEVLEGSIAASVRAAAEASQAFDDLSGTSTLEAALLALSAESTGSFGLMLGEASGQVSVSTLSNGAFAALEGDLSAVAIMRADAIGAFGPIGGVAMAANDNDEVSGLFFAVVS